MNCLRIKPYCDFPWFDDYKANRTAYKVYNDGSHYVAHIVNPASTRPSRPCGPAREKWHIDELFDESYSAGIIKNLNGSALKNFIKEKISEFYPGYPDLDSFIVKCLRRKARNLYMRKRRFRRKAYNYSWSYMVTFTYDDKKMNEETFRKRLKRRLSRFASELGWRIMGAFERGGNTDRLHFHGIAYIPDGKMVGELRKDSDFSVKSHHIQRTQSNTYFSHYFGRNDFKEVSDVELRRGGLEYILKYIEKGGERIYSSRGIKSEVEMDLLDEEIIGSETDRFGTTYYLFDDAVEPGFFLCHDPYIDGLPHRGTG